MRDQSPSRESSRWRRPHTVSTVGSLERKEGPGKAEGKKEGKKRVTRTADSIPALQGGLGQNSKFHLPSLQGQKRELVVASDP